MEGMGRDQCVPCDFIWFQPCCCIFSNKFIDIVECLLVWQSRDQCGSCDFIWFQTLLLHLLEQVQRLLSVSVFSNSRDQCGPLGLRKLFTRLKFALKELSLTLGSARQITLWSFVC